MVCPSCRADNDDAAEVCFTCRTILAAVTQGSVVAGRYQVLSFLGRGGMGTVYQAHDRVLDEDVAIKILRADVAGAPELAARFRSEIKLARRVSHANVCRIHEYGEDGPLQYISMELVNGPNLKEVLRRDGPLPAAMALDVLIQAARGLEAIHAAGIVHRDLKTLNITRDRDGRVRVMDFGIAKRLAPEGTDPTSSGYVVGSPEYMSPEQARGRKLDLRTDLYSLGVVGFELLTGSVPFRGDTPVATLLLHVEAPPPLDGPAAGVIPKALVPILRKALAKDPAERFTSALEMAEALVEAGEAARRGSGTAESTARVGRVPSVPWVFGFAALGLLVAAALVVFRIQAEPSRSAAPAAPTTIASPVPVAASAPIPSLVSSETPVPSPRSLAPPTTVRTPAARISPPPPTRPEAELGREPSEAQPIAAPPAPTTQPAATPPPVLETPQTLAPQPGRLLVLVTPWADVAVDGRTVGQTPLAAIRLEPGPHAVLLTHPDYQPFPRKITIRPGETLRLVVNLPAEGVRRKR